MTTGFPQLDRLLPRHAADRLAGFEWHLRDERVGLRMRRDVSTPARLVDLSLEGALVEVAERDGDLPVGSTVRLRLDGLEAEVEIKHRRSDGRHTFYGVRFGRDVEFLDHVADLVGELRGHREELARAWDRRN